MKRIFVHFLIGILLMQASFPLAGWGQELTPDSQSSGTTSESNAGIPPILEDDEEYPLSSNTIFDDKMLLQGYTERYKTLSQEIILEMIKDDTLTSYKAAAAVRVLREKYLNELPLREKRIFEKFLLRRLNRTDSPFVQVEILHTLCFLDRYHYFNPMVPALIQKMDHYNSTVDEMAFEALMDIIKKGNDRAREARIIFNTLRKVLFLSRKRLANIKEPGPRLSEKFQLLRWSIKILGTQELKSLPKEVINLM